MTSRTTSDNNYEMDSEQHTPVAKKLKSSPTDLIIRVGEEKYEYHCHSMIMASHSVFIDTALAMPMKESQTRTIDLPDVSIEIWNLMMKCIESPTEEPPMKTLSEIVSIAETFDKYEFPIGISICGKKITETYEDWMRKIISFSGIDRSTIDDLIECALRCHRIQLKESMPSILSFFRKALTLPEEAGSHYGGLIFKREQLKVLAPLIADTSLLGEGWTKEEIQCPLFPRYFLTTLRSEYEEKRFGPLYERNAPTHFCLQLEQDDGDCFVIADLKLHRQRTTPRFQHIYTGLTGNRSVLSNELRNAHVVLRRYTATGDWVVLIDRRPMWYSPLSFNCENYPPTKPWSTKPWYQGVINAPAGRLEVHHMVDSTPV